MRRCCGPLPKRQHRYPQEMRVEPSGRGRVVGVPQVGADCTIATPASRSLVPLHHNRPLLCLSCRPTRFSGSTGDADTAERTSPTQPKSEGQKSSTVCVAPVDKDAIRRVRRPRDSHRDVLRSLGAVIYEHSNERRNPAFSLHFQARLPSQTQPLLPREEVKDSRPKCQGRSKVAQMFHHDHSTLLRNHVGSNYSAQLQMPRRTRVAAPWPSARSVA
jgi:hypothetical protein